MNYLRHLNGFFKRLDEDKRLSSYHISLYLALFRQWNACRFSDRFVISRAETMAQARIGSANTYARCMKELTDWGYIHYKASSNLHCGSSVSCIRFDGEAGSASNIKTDTTTDTGINITADTGTSVNTKSDTTRNITTDTGIKDDTANNTGTSGDIENDTAASTTGGSSTPSNRSNDTATATNNSDNSLAGIKSGTGTDTASDTLLINITKNNKQEEDQKKKENQLEKKKVLDEKQEINPKSGQIEKTEIPDLSKVVSFFRQNNFLQGEARQFYAHYLSAGWKTGNNQEIVYWQALAQKWMTNNKKNNSHERKFNQIGAGRFSVPTDKDYSEPL